MNQDLVLEFRLGDIVRQVHAQLPQTKDATRMFEVTQKLRDFCLANKIDVREVLLALIFELWDCAAGSLDVASRPTNGGTS